MCNREKQIREVYEKLAEEERDPNKAKDEAIFGVLTSQLIERVLKRICGTK